MFFAGFVARRHRDHGLDAPPIPPPPMGGKGGGNSLDAGAKSDTLSESSKMVVAGLKLILCHNSKCH
ncbi:MAG: hypothetical protein ABSF10_22360 [Verrucomicrobiota bacterium]|jgi:hypothetical protein